jgi:hypothetical protein
MLQHDRTCSSSFNFVTKAIPVELSAAIARGFLHLIKSEAKHDNLDTTFGKLQLELYHHHHHHYHHPSPTQ